MVARRYSAVVLSTLVAVASPARADDIDYVQMAAKVIERACSGEPSKRIPTATLARAVLIETTRGVNIKPVADPVAQVHSPNDTISDEEANDIRGVRDTLLERLARPKTAIAKALLVTPAPPLLVESPGDWLFVADTRFVLTCAAQPEPKPDRFPGIGSIVMRKGAADLAKVGEERKSAGSAQFTFDDFQSTNLAGERKRTVKLVVNAAVGVAVGNANSDRYGLLYGEYSKSRARARTSPVATLTENDGRADDIDALEIGALGTTRLRKAVRATGRLGLIIDSVTHARYLGGNIAFEPITGGKPDLGICNLNSFKSIGLGIVARCGLAVEGDLRQVLRSGKAKLDSSDRLLALGGSASFAFQRGLDDDDKPQDGLTGGVTYRYLNMVAGGGPDIDRVDATIAYRWWSNDIGFDFGITYADGIERKSLADEHRIGLTFGLIF